MKVGIIGGTGFYNPGLLEKEKEVKMKTPFGDAVLKTGFYQGMEIFFLLRRSSLRGRFNFSTPT
jgi:5'-methylthioadenosine phosphorylase